MIEIKLAPIFPQQEDATSYYRGMGPITELSHTNNIGLIFFPSVSWATMKLADVLFMQRPFASDHLKMAQVAEKLGRPVWCDWDDDLFGVPEDNPAHATYSRDDVKHNVATIAAMADVVTLSTPALGERFNKIRKEIGKPDCIIVPNALDNHLVARRKPPAEGIKRRPLIFWRGSHTHMKDIMTVTDPLLDVMHERKDFTLHFLGYNPFWVKQCLPEKQCLIGQPLDILDYHTYLQEIQPGIVIVPLDDSPFNRGKSNIAWIEGTYGHAQIVAPDFEEWRRPGIYNYTDAKSFAEQLKRAMKDVDENNWAPIHEAWAYIRSNLMLSQTNKLRWDILKDLCPNKPQPEDFQNPGYYNFKPK